MTEEELEGWLDSYIKANDVRFKAIEKELKSLRGMVFLSMKRSTKK